MTITVGQALAVSRTHGLARMDAQLLLALALRRERSWIVAHDDHTLSAEAHEAWLHVLQRRSAGEPLAYLRAEREFHGLLLRVTPDVLIPRPETELLVQWGLDCIDAITLATGPGMQQRVVDLGTGSGAISLALKYARPRCEIVATDVSVEALAVARDNAAALGLAVRYLRSDWFESLHNEYFDVVVANPPYVAEDDPHLAALCHEPRLALISGADGLDAIRRLVADASDHLRDRGWLLLEHGCDQATRVEELMRMHGYEDIATRTDLAGLPRCTGGRMRPARRGR